MSDNGFSLRLLGKREIAPQVILCRYSLEDVGGFGFIPGQYLTLDIPVGATPLPRSFSIASRPEELPELTLIVKLIEKGAASDYFRNAKAGDSVTSTRPAGDFKVESRERPAIFIGAGAAVAPLFSMVADLVSSSGSVPPIRFLFYKRGEGYEEIETALRGLETSVPDFRLYIVTNGLPVNDILTKNDFTMSPDCYLCGSSAFVTDMEQKLVGAGVDPAAVYYEAYLRKPLS